MVEERRIRPIYEALDSRNHKQALKLCDALLKKSMVPLVQALKAVALERMGRVDEGFALAQEVGTSLKPPIDDHLLSTLLITYKAAGKVAEMVDVYERAHKAEPGSAELADALFTAYLRNAEYGKAQQLAMKQLKSQNADERLYTAMCCLLLQVDAMGPPPQPTRHYAETPPAAAATKHLQLAAAMLARAASQGKVVSAVHVRLYMEVRACLATYSPSYRSGAGQLQADGPCGLVHRCLLGRAHTLRLSNCSTRTARCSATSLSWRCTGLSCSRRCRPSDSIPCHCIISPLSPPTAIESIVCDPVFCLSWCRLCCVYFANCGATPLLWLSCWCFGIAPVPRMCWMPHALDMRCWAAPSP